MPDKDLAGLHTWDDVALRDPHGQPDKAERVRRLFDAIAPAYERFNRLATFGQDSSWRRAAVAAARPGAGEVVLDVACGTGDMIRAFAAAQPRLARIIGVDFAPQMLKLGRYRSIQPPVELIEADALALPLPEACVDIASCAFGVRNFADLSLGLREMYRVLRPGGRIVILEFAIPENRWIRRLYEVYCGTVLPWLGRKVARDGVGAYEYLPRSVRTFEPPHRLADRLAATGFSRIRLRHMNFGGVVLYHAVKAPAAGK